MSRMELTDKVKEKYIGVVKDFISERESLDISSLKEQLKLDLSNTELNPHTLYKMLENLGYMEYKREEIDSEMNFRIVFSEFTKRFLLVSGCGITFELHLGGLED